MGRFGDLWWTDTRRGPDKRVSRCARADSTAAPGRGMIWPPAHTASCVSMRPVRRWPAFVLLSAALVAGCGDERQAPPFDLPAGARPIGPGPRFHPPLRPG